MYTACVCVQWPNSYNLQSCCKGARVSIVSRSFRDFALINVDTSAKMVPFHASLSNSMHNEKCLSESFTLVRTMILFSSNNDLFSKFLMSNDKKKSLPIKMIFTIILS